MKYRVVQYKPDVFAIQTKSRWWPFWTYHRGDYGICEYRSMTDARYVIQHWLNERNHVFTVVMEYREL